jgi:two-component system, OmpR family, sensor histidine kinase KdpD
MSSAYSWSTRRRYLLSAAAVAAITLALGALIPGMQQANIALFYLLAVLICATTFGLGPAILASLLAFLAFNFFFVPPLHTFDVAKPEDLLELITFLAVAIIASGLAGRARAQAEAAQRHATELAALYDLSQAMSTAIDLEQILPAIVQTTARLLDVPACSVLLYDANGRLIERAVWGAEPAAAFRRVDTFLRVGQRILGVLRVTQRSLHASLSPSEQKLLDTIVTQVVLLLERARLVHETSQTRALAESERLKSALLSSVSHDLRTPLAVIKGSVTNLLDETVGWDSAARRELLNAMNDEADRLNRLVSNLLEMSRVEAGALHSARSWQDAAELIAAVTDQIRPRLAGRPLTVDAPDDLPLVRFNYAQIEQVLVNLLENAAKYTPESASIVVSARAEPDAVRIEVRDAGPGIPAGMIERIFEKFVRAIGPEQHASGSGLGLAICRGIVEAHGGRIWAENLPAGGARFAFTLPRESAALAPAALSEEEALT